MTHRSRNRLAEHGPHGWVETSRTHVMRRNMRLMECPCGWLGWVDVDAIDSAGRPVG